MILRKLNPEENIRARALYEEVFPEDDDQFVDYYFNWKTKDNVIYAAENAEGIHATVHLNPFWVYWNGEVQRMHYIVAVATRKEYRHQGLMRRLLAMAEQDMQEAGETFTFLMPANENIYLPFGYRFFAWQRQGILRADIQSDNRRIICRPVEPYEYALLADFVNEELKKQHSMFIWRDAAYYERLCAEQQCQGGEVMVICRELNCSCSDAVQASGQNAVQVPQKDTAQASEQGAAQRSQKDTAQTSDRNADGKQYEILGTFCTAREESEDSEKICFAGSEGVPESAGGNRESAESCLGEKITISSLVLREIILDTVQFQIAEEALLSYISANADANIKANTEANINDDTDINRSVNAAEVINTESNSHTKAYCACRVEGCQQELTLQNEVWKLLLMGKGPGQAALEKIWEKKAVFINEVV